MSVKDTSQTTPCVSCGTTGGSRPQRPRGLCEACYSRVRQRGQLDDYPRTYRKRAELLEDLDFLGFDPRLPTDPQLAALHDRLGVSFAALRRALERARKDGAYPMQRKAVA